jgi:hypothetical protein
MSCIKEFPTNRQLVFSSFFPFLKRLPPTRQPFSVMGSRFFMVLPQKQPDLLDNFLVVGKAFGLVFGKNDSVSGRDVIYTVASRDQFRGDVQFGFNVGCQTGSTGLIVSDGTIGDFDIHGLLSFSVLPGITGPESGNGCFLQ